MGLVTSKTAEATYQPKSLMGNYVTQGELKNFEDRYGDEIKKFTEATYQPKANYVTQGELKNFEDRYGDELKKFTDATYQPKASYVTQGELKKFEDRFGDEIKRFAAAYVPKAELNDFRPNNLNVANGFNAPKANATLYGVTLDSGGISSLNNAPIYVNNDLSLKGNVCDFKNNCISVGDLIALKSQSGKTPIPMGVAVAPSKYLRTRNYMDY